MKLIMADRIDPPTGWEASYYGKGKRFVQLERRDDGALWTRWGPVIEQREEGDQIHLVERSITTESTEAFTIPKTKLVRLEQAASWELTWLPNEERTFEVRFSIEHLRDLVVKSLP